MDRGRARELCDSADDHFVSVRIRRRARAGLKYIDRKLCDMASIGDFPSRLLDKPAFLWSEFTQLSVRLSRSKFDEPEALNDGRWHGPTAHGGN